MGARAGDDDDAGVWGPSTDGATPPCWLRGELRAPNEQRTALCAEPRALRYERRRGHGACAALAEEDVTVSIWMETAVHAPAVVPVKV